MPRTLRIRRLPLLALVVLLVVGLAAPAGSESLSAQRRRRDAARAQRAKIAAKLNALKATDAQLEAAVRTLNTQVRAQQAKADAARRSVAAALAAVARAEARLAATEREMAQMRSAVVNRAVSAYVRPQSDTFSELVTSRDLNEATRRTSLLAQVTNRDRDVIDQLRAKKQDYEEEKVLAAKARDVANSRKAAVDRRLAEVRRARDEKARLEAALDQRIRAFQAQADQAARHEGSLASLIRSREAAGRASRGDIDTGRVVSGVGLIWPVGGSVTSEYGYRWGRLHAGIDIANRTGTPIRAAKSGEVIFAGTMSGYGNVVVINHGGGFSTLYAHQSRLATNDGASVERGQLIGYVGSTGHSTGPHLHFETRVDGSAQNPRRYLP